MSGLWRVAEAVGLGALAAGPLGGAPANACDPGCLLSAARIVMRRPLQIRQALKIQDPTMPRAQQDP